MLTAKGSSTHRPGSYHHDQLPKVGAVVSVQDDRSRRAMELSNHLRWRKFRVESYATATWYERRHGTPLVHLIALDNGQRVKVNSSLCQPID